MTYTFPESLAALHKYLKSRGFEGDSVKTSRQAAFVAQQLLGTRVKFPPQGQDMTLVLIEIEKAVPAQKREPDLSRDGKALRAKTAEASPKAGTGSRRSPSGGSNIGSFDNNGLRQAQAFDVAALAEGAHIFCDGCCEPNPGAGGWGVVVYLNGVENVFEFGGSAETTNNQMELTGLLHAINEAWKFIPDWGQVTIWCDSQYCVKGVNEWLAGWKANGWNRKKPNSPNRAAGEIKNLELWQSIDAAVTDAPKLGYISIRWVKGHAGIVGNERADELAEIGRQEAMELVGNRPEVGEDLDERYRQIMGAA